MTESVETMGTEETPAPTLSLQDIATTVQIIDIVSKRGGFEGPELEQIGGLRSRIVAFLEANKPADADAPEGSVPEVVEADASTDGE